MTPGLRAITHLCCAVWLCSSLTIHAAPTDAIAADLDKIVAAEMQEWNIGGIAVALVYDQQVVYARGYGEARRDSIFRVGSISKLFNAVAVMQQVEAGKLNLDAPLPSDLTPINPFPDSDPVTLRQLLCHRSGLTREATLGGYLDESEPSLRATVATVPSSVLVTRPGEKTRYSNIGPSVAGVMVERAGGIAFEEYQRQRILGPLGMTSSAWTRARLPKDRLVVSHIRVADERGGFKRIETPVFDLGTIPAGNLFSTVDDLARFASALLSGGSGILKRETLAEMWRPQLTKETNGFGIAFAVGTFRGRKLVSHSGAVYGHSTSFSVLPDDKIAVIVLANEDIANGRVHRISQAALSMMLKEPLSAATKASKPGAADQLASFAGDYESQSFWAKLEIKDGKLLGNISGQPTKLTPTGPLAFTVDSLLEDAAPATFWKAGQGTIAGFRLGIQKFQRVSNQSKPLPAEWRGLLGSYGSKLIPLVVSERHGHLYVMTENMVDYRLTPVNRNVCALPPGMYVDEQMVFFREGRERARAVNFANMYFKRR